MTLEDLVNPEFEVQKVQTLLNHINCPDDQVKENIHTTMKDHKDEFSVACSYLVKKIHMFLLKKIQNFSNSSIMHI